MRGRLIKPFLIEIAQLDVEATRKAGGYDDVLKTVKPLYDAKGNRTQGQVYADPIRVRAQQEIQSTGLLQQGLAGNFPMTRLATVLHRKELEQRKLLKEDGNPVFKTSDILVAIYRLTGALMKKFEKPLYCTQVQTTGFGIGGYENLLVLSWEDRPLGMK